MGQLGKFCPLIDEMDKCREVSTQILYLYQFKERSRVHKQVVSMIQWWLCPCEVSFQKCGPGTRLKP